MPGILRAGGWSRRNGKGVPEHEPMFLAARLAEASASSKVLGGSLGHLPPGEGDRRARALLPNLKVLKKCAPEKSDQTRPPKGARRLDSAGSGWASGGRRRPVLVKNVIAVDFSGGSPANSPAGLRRVSGKVSGSPAASPEKVSGGSPANSPAGLRRKSPAGLRRKSPAGLRLISPAGFRRISPAGLRQISPSLRRVSGERLVAQDCLKKKACREGSNSGPRG